MSDYASLSDSNADLDSDSDECGTVIIAFADSHGTDRIAGAIAT
jgi:hypothetical protein